MIWADTGEAELKALAFLFFLIAVLPVPFLILATRRHDKAPDFLSNITTKFLERTGFCFVPSIEFADGTCYLVLHFQNRYERACEAFVELECSDESQQADFGLSAFRIEISCPPAGFGRAAKPWPIPPTAQGRDVRFNVFAKVRYPNGRGGLVRFRDGRGVGAMGLDYAKVGTALLTGLAGHLSAQGPAQVVLNLPAGVRSDFPKDSKTATETIWKWGDSPLIIGQWYHPSN
jgi:hypothetical protein